MQIQYTHETVPSHPALCWCGGLLKPSVHPLYRQCIDCGTFVLKTVYSPEELQAFYSLSGYWRDHQIKVSGFPPIEQRAVADFNDRIPYWFHLVKKYGGRLGALLEIGCAHGGFLAYCRAKGLETVVGVEVDEGTCRFAREYFNLPFVCSGLFPDVVLPFHKFDTIVGFDVIEHFHDPVTGIRAIGKLLTDDGCFILQTPCYRGEDETWPQFMPDEHLFLFNEQNIQPLFSRCGLEITTILPGYFKHDMFIIGRKCLDRGQVTFKNPESVGVDRQAFRPVTIYPTTEHIVGRVLLCYIARALVSSDDSPVFKGHSNAWECSEIARIFANMGYVVDAIDYSDDGFVPSRSYDVIFDIFYKISCYEQLLRPDTLKILHITGSHLAFSNRAESDRVEQLKLRKRGAAYYPKRSFQSDRIEAFNRSMELADFCTLIGNQVTLDTFPEQIRNKIVPVTVSSAFLGPNAPAELTVPPEREFLWLGGGGAVMKGLDLTLDVFYRNRHLTLHVVGLGNEEDFKKIYEQELFHAPNIHYHGFLYPDSDQFGKLIKKVFCFIAPASSEGISTAVTTSLQLGLYPIISRNTGVDLPHQCGIYLETCSVDEIEVAVYRAYRLSNRDLIRQIRHCYLYAWREFSRERFSAVMAHVLRTRLAGSPR